MAKHMAPVPDSWSDDAADVEQTQVSAEPAPESAAQPDPAPEPDPAAQTPASTDGKKPAKRSNLVSNLLIVVGVALLVVAGVIFFNNQRNYQKIDEENERVAEYVKLADDGEQPPTVDWEALKAMNSDVVGWLQVPGTVVNYPVFQSGDNDYYLSHAPDKSESIGGSVFLDAENTKPGMVDTQSIVYGHHMRNGSQFKQIADMENQELFDGVKTVWYVTENQPYELAPLFVYYTNEEDTDVRQFSFDKDADFRAYLKKYLGEARAKRSDIDQVLGSVRHIFTLSTCNYEDGYGRTLLVCAPKSEIPGMEEYDAAAAQKAADEQAAKEKAEQEKQRAEELAEQKRLEQERLAQEDQERLDAERAAQEDAAGTMQPSDGATPAAQTITQTEGGMQEEEGSSTVVEGA